MTNAGDEEHQMSEITITEADVSSFREKLDTWAATLTEGEHAILLVIAARAFPQKSEPEVSGFGQDWIEIVSYSHHVTQPTSATRPGFSQVAFGGGTIDSLIGTRVVGRP